MSLPEVPRSSGTGANVARGVSDGRPGTLGLVWVFTGPRLRQDSAPACSGAALRRRLPAVPGSGLLGVFRVVDVGDSSFIDRETKKSTVGVHEIYWIATCEGFKVNTVRL